MRLTATVMMAAAPTCNCQEGSAEGAGLAGAPSEPVSRTPRSPSLPVHCLRIGWGLLAVWGLLQAHKHLCQTLPTCGRMVFFE